MAKKRGKIVSVKVQLFYPSSSQRFLCRYQAFTPSGESYWKAHKFKDGDELHYCDELVCRDQVCQDHWADHQQWHTLHKLGGSN